MYACVDLWLAMFLLPKSDLKSLHFAVTRVLMKLFKTSNTEEIAESQRYFRFFLPSELAERRRNQTTTCHFKDVLPL